MATIALSGILVRHPILALIKSLGQIRRHRAVMPGNAMLAIYALYLTIQQCFLEIPYVAIIDGPLSIRRSTAL